MMIFFHQFNTLIHQHEEYQPSTINKLRSKSNLKEINKLNEVREKIYLDTN